MGETEQDIIRYLEQNPGLSDKELAEAVKGRGKPSQYINEQCRGMAARKILLREKRPDGLIGNWLQKDHYLSPGAGVDRFDSNSDEISEKKMKQALEAYLNERKWDTEIAWGSGHGVDIEATQGSSRWIIEVKGAGAYSPLRANYFVTVLGELLQRMDDPDCKYSIALPEIEQFRRLWERLPSLAKTRIGITALFVDVQGKVTEKTA
ncbi:MAG TPA: hypothetical protein VF318_03505 [Dehalococcoidales bacterium]|jgi:hypothetical protein